MIGNMIYEIRKKRGFTLSELAIRARISKSNLSNIERNINTNPSIDVIKKIALVLDVDLKTLLGNEIVDDTQKHLDEEWLDFVYELKKSGIEREQFQEYKSLIEFLKWKNEKLGENN
ncbi:helix-turn-helix transcriptional regulator [Neobacillus sp. PS3-40]|uniref:helix-turn-helix domain-containing protein n=1 Tax=Neobacillus sp. PS3-40 TaxID=3070679 RepID=UPI0027DFC7AF|nr:helix-turn-helix transcriptional regulator [Neobacillus sp. PS3-40]WML45817.1 helix-turn-helix transcriptional regulator [Neobacillus sp. PS3-40]